MSYIYLANPYHHKNKTVMARRVFEVQQVTAELLHKGEVVFSPIVHNHQLAQMYNLPLDWSFWSKIDLCMLGQAKALYILTLHGWESSRGVAEEMIFAGRNGIPISYINMVGKVSDEP